MSNVMESRVYDPTDHTAVGEGETVVLLPGLFAGEWIWDGIRESLRGAGYRVVSMTHPFVVFGRALATIQDLRGAVLRMLDDLEIGACSFVANSLGGLVQLDLARVQPERVKSLILSGTPGLEETNLGLGCPRRLDHEFASKLIPRLFHDPSVVPPEAVSRICEILTRRRYNVNFFRLLTASREYDVRAALTEIRCPVLLLWGREDRVTPLSNWEAEAPRMANARIRVVERSGHSPMVERPAEFTRYAIEFLREITQGAPYDGRR